MLCSRVIVTALVLIDATARLRFVGVSGCQTELITCIEGFSIPERIAVSLVSVVDGMVERDLFELVEVHVDVGG